MERRGEENCDERRGGGRKEGEENCDEGEERRVRHCMDDEDDDCNAMGEEDEGEDGEERWEECEEADCDNRSTYDDQSCRRDERQSLVNQHKQVVNGSQHCSGAIHCGVASVATGSSLKEAKAVLVDGDCKEGDSLGWQISSFYAKLQREQAAPIQLLASLPASVRKVVRPFLLSRAQRKEHTSSSDSLQEKTLGASGTDHIRASETSEHNEYIFSFFGY